MATILVVDDERRIRDSLFFLLQARGQHCVHVAGTAREAQEMAQTHPPDLLIMDWMLADNVDGLQIAGLIRESQPSLPVILVTGFVSDDLQTQVDSLSRTWLLSKPCDFEELLRTIELALQAKLDEGDETTLKK